MLIRFQVANYRSIKEPVELSMVAIDRDRPAVRRQFPLGESLVPVAAIYGPNASGKSNLLSAFVWLQTAVVVSLRGWTDTIPVDPFAFGSLASSPTEFELEMTVDGVRYEYLLEVDANRVLYEALFHYPQKLRKRVFERVGDTTPVIQRGLGTLAGARDLLTPRTLLLSAASRSDVPEIRGFASQLVGAMIRGPIPIRAQYASRRLVRYSGGHNASTARLFETSYEPSLFDGDEPSEVRAMDARSQALAMLRMADLGIDDVYVDEEVTPLEDGTKWRRQRISMMHRVGGASERLPYSEESAGTREWFDLIGPVQEALRRGGVLLADELDASLHPVLSAHLIKLFHDPATNHAGAQLVFTAHDTNLMSSLHRDEIWFTQKLEDGSTRLGPLSEFAKTRVRTSSNLAVGYLNGRFGALPNVDDVALLRSLGLIG